MKQMRRTEKEDAVSPVIGVMLMLVVTIIIAAVVAAFAGGLASDTDAADSAIIKLDSYDMATVDQMSSEPWTTYTAGYKQFGAENEYRTSYGVYNMTFLHKGGDKLDVTKLRLGITYDGATEFTPLSKVTDVKSWGVGEKLVLTTGPEMMEEIGGTHNTYFKPKDGLFWGLSQQKLGAPGNSFEWMILDGSGNVIVKGTAFA